jgi:tetratricopeptide (TPR) repeat protein
VLALQDEMATRIARALQLAVDTDTTRQMRRLQSTEAYNLYLHGRALQDQLHVAQLLEAARDFEQALVLDPSFLRAAEALAWTYVAQGYDEDVLSRDAWKSAREAAQRALRIDSNSAAAHGVLGVVYALDEYDWEAAATEFSKGLALNPRDTVTLGYAAIIAQSRGKYVEAQRLFSASLALDPLNPFTLYSIGDMYYKMGNLADSESAFRKCLASNATFDGGHFMIGRIHLVRREIEAAQTEFQADVAADAKDAGLSMYYHATGKNSESDAALANLIKASGDTWPYIVAIVHAYRGERNEAFDWLEQAYATRDSDFLASVRADPELEPLRADSRYKAFLKKMNLPE